MTTGRADVIVVGAGTAGCVVAARVSADPGRQVLLLEAGPDPRPIPDVVGDPARQTELILKSPYVRMLDAERQDGSTFPLLAGRILGGGSSVNNLAYVRPMAIDFATWARFGGSSWSFESMLPLMRAIERDEEFADSPWHGGSGPLAIHRPFRVDGPDDPSQPTIGALKDAAHALGLPDCPDMNVPAPIGVCASPYNWVEGRRQSMVDAYLDPVRERPNLRIIPDTTVTQLIFDGKRVTGVEASTRSGSQRFVADQVVLSAGAYGSPHLLMLSGVGSPAALEPHGVTVRHRLDGVGRNHHDHAVVYVTYAGTSDLHEDHVIPKVRLIAKSDPALDRPDLHVFLRPSIRMPGVPPLLPVSIHLLEHRSAGRVGLVSSDPGDDPTVDAGLLQDPDDVRAMLDGIDFADRLTAHPALARFYGPMVAPADRSERREHVLSGYDSYHHGVGTCRMGAVDDVDAVVDGTLHVRGLDNLWIADASILPTVPHANTNVAAILVGEMGARSLGAPSVT